MGKRGVLCLSYPAWALVCTCMLWYGQLFESDLQCCFLHFRCLKCFFVDSHVATCWTYKTDMVDVRAAARHCRNIKHNHCRHSRLSGSLAAHLDPMIVTSFVFLSRFYADSWSS